MARHHDHRSFRIDITQRLQGLEAVPIRQPDIEEDDIRVLFTKQMQGLLAARGGDGAVTLVAEDLRQGRQDALFVINNQNQFVHGGASVPSQTRRVKESSMQLNQELRIRN